MPPRLKVNISPKVSAASSFSVSDSGTFQQGDLVVGKRGLRVKGATPVAATQSRGLGNPSASGGVDQALTSVAESLEAASVAVFSPAEDDGSSSPRALTLDDCPLQLKLDDLEILDILGQGASGVVRKAIHVPTGATLALKMIPLDVSEEKVRRQIVLELKSLHQSQCEQVVTFFDAFCDEGNVLIALEFMGGGSLGDLLSDGVVFPEEILAPITEQVLSGLNYIHKTMRLIHRDIKPANLLINRSGEVKISDFGVSGELAHTLSQANTWVGTVVYMSPERIKGQPHSYDSDIWALGLTVLELAVGKLPFDALPQQAAGVGAEGAQFWELMESIVDGNPPRLPRKDFSEDCCDFVETCLQKDPENRPSARELLLRHFVKAGSGPDGAQRMHQWMREVLGGKK